MPTNTTNTTETQKQGDTLILTGALSEESPLGAAAWVGAVAKANIANADTGAVTIDHGAATLDLTPLALTPPLPARYRYQGTMPAVGSYLYEIEVTFADGTVLTWPNDGSKNKLKVIAQLG